MSNLTNQEIVRSLARKVKQVRMNHELTQQELARRAGINVNTLRHFEAGENSSLLTFISVARVLQLEDGILSAIPEGQMSPLQALKYKTLERKRVRRKG